MQAHLYLDAIVDTQQMTIISKNYKIDIILFRI